MKVRRLSKPIILILTTVMLIAFVTPQISASDSEFSPNELKEINKISKQLQIYFEEVGELTENGYIVKNEELLKARIDAGDSTAIMIYEFIQLRSIPVLNATAFGKCVVDKFANSYGTIARQFLNGAIFTYIKTKQYDLAARLMFSTLVKAGFKVNAVGLAVEAGIYGWQCRGEL